MSAKLRYAEKLKVEFACWINFSSRNENQMHTEEKKAVDSLSLLQTFEFIIDNDCFG